MHFFHISLKKKHVEVHKQVMGMNSIVSRQ